MADPQFRMFCAKVAATARKAAMGGDPYVARLTAARSVITTSRPSSAAPRSFGQFAADHAAPFS
jgi:hypothetical protein